MLVKEEGIRCKQHFYQQDNMAASRHYTRFRVWKN